ncbi:MAG: hypothetical protein ABIB71_08710 [Candidatus Woesearchaeota archaeon]
MKIRLIVLIAVLSILLVGNASAAHYVIGRVFDALDGTEANEWALILYKTDNGMTDNETDIIGPSGNSGADNIYMIDCELLSSPCDIGDNITARVLDNNSKYYSGPVTLLVTGAGYDIMPDMTLTKNITAPVVGNVDIDEGNSTVLLNAGAKRKVMCNGSVMDLDGAGDVVNATAVFYDRLTASEDSADDNNTHYSNNSCVFVTAISATEKSMHCTFEVNYYANNNTDDWECNITATDSYNQKGSNTDTIGISELVALSVTPTVDYGSLNVGSISGEKTITVTNNGNVRLDLTVYGYAQYQDDGNALNCTDGGIKNITISNERYNYTASGSFEEKTALASSPTVITEFNLMVRTDDDSDNAYNHTYWQLQVPSGVEGQCLGTIVMQGNLG